ncbi:Ferredoxin [compost metagenome]
MDAEAAQDAISDEVYYIVSDKCTECKGFHDEPQCAAVCPVDCCVDDEDVRETEEELLAKKAWLHQEG